MMNTNIYKYKLQLPIKKYKYMLQASRTDPEDGMLG